MSEWIEFKSGVQPVPDGVQVKIKTVDGDIEIANAECFTWEIGGYNSDIVAYKVEGNPHVSHTPRDKPAFPTKGNELARQQAEGLGMKYNPPFGMSLREYAAIKLRVPDSGTDWLDAMIERSLLNEFAGKAMQSIMNDSRYGGVIGVNNYQHRVSADGYAVAIAMLKASKGE